MSQNIETYEELKTAWGQLINTESKYHANPTLYALEDVLPDGYEVTGVTGFGRHERALQNLMRFLVSISPMEKLTILVTTMSVGCELYEAIKIAKDFNLFSHHGNVEFYGHDISESFVERAEIAVYPADKIEHLRFPSDYFSPESPHGSQDFVQIRPDLRERAIILPASDIRDLDFVFDVVIGNVVNPAPSGYLRALFETADHLVFRDRKISGLSPEFRSLYEAGDYSLERHKAVLNLDCY